MPFPLPSQIARPRKPTLLPNFDRPTLVSTFKGGAILETLDDITEAYAVMAPTALRAKAIYTLTAVGDDNDTLTVKIRGVTIVVTKTASESTVTLLAAKAIAAINAEPKLRRYVVASNSAGAIRLDAVYPGQVPNDWTVSFTPSGNMTGSATTAWGGGTGDIVTPLEDFAVRVNNYTVQLYANRPFISTAEIRAALKSLDFAVS